jgi:hypothetical protein
MNEATTPRALPALIPMAGTKEQVPLALATREQLELYTQTAEQFAQAHAAKHADLKAVLAQWKAALAYFPPHALADMTLKRALELRGPHESTEANETKGSIARQVEALQRAAAHEAREVEAMNALALAGRTALAMFRKGDPASLTYGQAYGRAQAAAAAPPPVHVAAPTVNVSPASVTVEVPDRPRTITARRADDGSLVATVQPA